MESINIRTTQNVVINYELAPLRDRFVGLLIDILLISAIHMCLAFSTAFLLNSESELLLTILQYFGLIAFFFYTLVMEIFNNGQTLGKRAMGTKVLKICYFK